MRTSKISLFLGLCERPASSEGSNSLPRKGIWSRVLETDFFVATVISFTQWLASKDPSPAGTKGGFTWAQAVGYRG